MMGEQRTDFDDFVVARWSYLRGIAYGLCGDWHRADDVVQNALVKLYVAWPRLHRGGAEDAYARQTVIRAAIDESRRPWRRERSGLDDWDVAARTGPDPAERVELFTALRALPEMQRRTVVLRHWAGLSVAETAQELRISEGTVKSHTSRALERLNRLMSPEEMPR